MLQSFAIRLGAGCACAFSVGLFLASAALAGDRTQFPCCLVGAPPEASQVEQASMSKAEAEKNPGIRRGSGR